MQQTYNNIRNKANQYFGSNKQQQMQAETFAPAQKATAQTQNIIQQVDDLFDTVTLAAQMFQNRSVGESTLNRICDGTVLSLNAFAGTFAELYKENDKNSKNSILLAKKRAFDHFQALKLKDPDTYNLIEPHRFFINAALNGEQNLKFKSDRVRPDTQKLCNQDADVLQDAWSTMIKYDQEYDKTQESYLDPKTNKQLADEHKSQLNEIRHNNKYQQITKQQKYNRPKQTDFYWTKSGKKSKFIDTKAMEQKEAEQQAMDEDILGAAPTAYDVIKSQVSYNNAIIQFSSQKPWKYNKRTTVKSPICCKILGPSSDKPDEKVKVQPCKPYNKVTLQVPVSMLLFDKTQIKQLEQKFIRKYRELGYVSIEDQEDIDVDMQ